MDLENRGVIFACLYDSLVVQRLKLLNSLSLRALEALQLKRGVRSRRDNLGLNLLEELDFADCDTLENRFTCCDYHGAYLLLNSMSVFIRDFP